MNYENSKTTEPYRLLINLSDEINLKRSDKYVALSNLSIYYVMDKYKKGHTKAINLKYLSQLGVKNLNYEKDHILHQIFKVILSI